VPIGDQDETRDGHRQRIRPSSGLEAVA
jgi:hypothetical protein